MKDIMEKKIQIDTNRRDFFKQYLSVLKPLLKPRLSNGELNVLGELLYLNDKYKDIEPALREKLIHDYDNKIAIIDHLDMSYNSFSNVLTSLRKKNYLKDNTINKNLIIEPGNTININYTFNIDDTSKENK